MDLAREAVYDKKAVWEDDNDMVSLGSSTQELLESNGDEYSEDNLDGMSIDNTVFTQHDIRYTALPDERKPTTNSLSALICWTSTLSYSSAVCSLLDVLPKACFNQCTHGLAYSACSSCKGKGNQLKEITPFWILDSGASLHFTGERHNFVTFEELPIPLPIQTTNGTAYITGRGLLSLKHISARDEVVTTTIN